MTNSERQGSEPGNTSNDPSLEDLPSTVASIVESMGRGRISRLVLSKGDFHLEIEASTRPPQTAPVVEFSSDESDMDEDTPSSASTHVITSPMIGTFYAAPAPGEPPFIQIGDVVAQGDTVGIVEAMKIMNEIATDRAGTVVRIVANDGDTVEYGSPLVEVDQSA